jgi:hypothetical protein
MFLSLFDDVISTARFMNAGDDRGRDTQAYTTFAWRGIAGYSK